MMNPAVLGAQLTASPSLTLFWGRGWSTEGLLALRPENQGYLGWALISSPSAPRLGWVPGRLLILEPRDSELRLLTETLVSLFAL